jgi:DNA-binding HxlR family transcriptional regulator
MKKNSVVAGCPIDTAINVLKGKCKAAIVLKIKEGHVRFGSLKRETGTSKKLLAIQLNELSQDQIILKNRLADDSNQTFYTLTNDGEKLCNIVQRLFIWGGDYKGC